MIVGEFSLQHPVTGVHRLATVVRQGRQFLVTFVVDGIQVLARRIRTRAFRKVWSAMSQKWAADRKAAFVSHMTRVYGWTKDDFWYHENKGSLVSVVVLAA